MKYLFMLSILLIGCAETTKFVDIPTKNLKCLVHDITGLGFSAVPDFDTLTVNGTLVSVASINNYTVGENDTMPMLSGTPASHMVKNVAIKCSGKLEVPVNGTYRFDLMSDDGSLLYIGGKKVIDNDGSHGNVTKTVNVYLVAGLHNIKVEYFEGLGPKSLTLSWTIPGGVSSIIPAESFK